MLSIFISKSVNAESRCGVYRSGSCDSCTFKSTDLFPQRIADYTFVFGRHPRSPKVCCNIIGAG